jgi:DivIVA domain-containing protein
MSMAQFTPDDITQQTFRTSFRGFDPNEVRSYLESLAAAVAGLVKERDQIGAKLAELGERDLKTEFESVGREVSAVLEAARDAADQLRQRATNDATRWRSEAVAEAEQELRRARADAEQLRGDAWATADELLRQVISEAERIEARTEKERLRMVGEAEREAHRVVAAGRREAEDMIRTAKVESERLTVNAQTAHDELIARANRQADASQERTRALEIRRQELKVELDSIRHALATAEGELEERRSALHLSPQTPPTPTVRAAEPSVPPPAGPLEKSADPKPEGEWTPGETVRVVRPGVPGPGLRTTVRGPISETPEIVVLSPAEVRARREEGESGPDEASDIGDVETVEQSTDESPSQGAEAGDATDVGEVDAEAAPSEEASGEEHAEPAELEIEEAAAVTEAVMDSEPALEVSSDAQASEQLSVDESPGLLEEPHDESPEMPLDEAADHDTGRFEELSGLFARLREPSTEPPTADEPSEAAVADPQPVSEPKRPVAVYQGDPFELRARLLLPVSNRALRNIKRQLTEAQNEALEELRLSDGQWEPDGPALGTRVRPDLVVLSAESFAAGHAAAMEMSGERFKRPSTPKTEPEVEWVAGLLGDLNHALAEGRKQGQGARQLGASVSRVFRAWRTDEAERRVTELASSRYHVGLSEVAIENGFSTEWVVSGRGCSTCRTNAESVPGDWGSLPPAHANCDCTLTLV